MVAATGQPLYQQVADDLRSQIAAGRLKVGDDIPSTAELAEQHQVSIGVVRTAVRLLQTEGLLIGQSGKAVYVRATPETVATEAAALKSVDEQLAELRTEVQSMTGRQPEVAVRLGALEAKVGRLQEDLRTLYNRLGHPYPRHDDGPKQKRRGTGS